MGRKKLKRRAKGNTIFREKFLSMLRQCYLNGAIAEATLTIEKGEGEMELIDITNTITISSKMNIGSDDLDCHLGLGDLELIIKFLSSLEDKWVLFNNNKKHILELTTMDGRRKLMYLLTKPELVVTNVEDEYHRMFKKLQRKMLHQLELGDGIIRDILSYINMIKEKGLSLKLDDGLLSIVYGDVNEHQFEVVLDNNFDEGVDDFDIHLSGDFIAKILNSIEYDKGDNPILGFCDATLPVMIKSTNTVYFVTPIVETE